jgi:hypothetical protein
MSPKPYLAPAGIVRVRRPVYVVLLLLMAGCAGTQPADEDVGSTSRPPPGPDVPPAARQAPREPSPEESCRWANHEGPKERQPTNDPVEVTIRIVGNREGSAFPSKAVAAVPIWKRSVDSRFDVDVEFNGCAFASATTGKDGAAILHLARGQGFRVGVEPHFGTTRPTAGPYNATAGLVIKVPWFDPDVFQPDECGVPRPPDDLPDDEAFAKDLIEVEVEVRWENRTGTPMAGAVVAALNERKPPPYRETLDTERFFSSCIWATAEADPQGIARMLLPRGVRVNLIAPIGAGDVVRDVAVNEGRIAALYPLGTQKDYVWTGDILLPTDRSVVPLSFHADPAVDALYRARFRDTFFVHLRWNNTPTSWGDLYGCFRIAEADLDCNEIFDAPQGPFDGPVSETLIAPFSFFNEETCKVRAEGLSISVYSPPQHVVAPLRLPFTLDTFVSFIEHPDLRSWDPAPCP